MLGSQTLMSGSQTFGLRIESKYLTPIVASVDADRNLLGDELAEDLEELCNNQSIHVAVAELMNDGWEVVPVTITNYIFLARRPHPDDETDM